jgi:hypothetical protein
MQRPLIHRRAQVEMHKAASGGTRPVRVGFEQYDLLRQYPGVGPDLAAYAGDLFGRRQRCDRAVGLVGRQP